MKFILLIMMFTTAPANGPKIEAERVWSFQSSTTMEFATDEGCKAAGYAVSESLRPVGTLTARAWCICESTDPNRKCPKKAEDKLNATVFRKLQSDSNVEDEGRVSVQTLSPK